MTKNETRPSASSYSHPQSFAAGADLKYGLSSNLTLNATINPDFGQVEADPAVLNLSAFEQFFEERRPFFLEGSGIFSFMTACDDIDTGCTGLQLFRRSHAAGNRQRPDRCWRNDHRREPQPRFEYR